jgi:thiosulfate dehydrogenase (quinone) large subunit
MNYSCIFTKDFFSFDVLKITTMLKSYSKENYTNVQAFFLVTLRVLIGWYFLYEGLTKLVNPDWSCVGYLLDSQGPFAGMFTAMAGNMTVVTVVNWLNIWGLTLIGLGLLLGLLTQLSLVFGIVLLIMYYMSHPALASVSYAMPMEGSYLIINKTLIEIFAMAVLLVFPNGNVAGLDRFISKWFKK